MEPPDPLAASVRQVATAATHIRRCRVPRDPAPTTMGKPEPGWLGLHNQRHDEWIGH